MATTERELTMRAAAPEARAAAPAEAPSRVKSVTAADLGAEPTVEVPKGAEEWRQAAERITRPVAARPAGAPAGT